MTAQDIAYDDLPLADEEFIRAHREELFAMATSLGLTNVRYAARNRLVVTFDPSVPPMNLFKYS